MSVLYFLSLRYFYTRISVFLPKVRHFSAFQEFFKVWLPLKVMKTGKKFTEKPVRVSFNEQGAISSDLELECANEFTPLTSIDENFPLQTHPFSKKVCAKLVCWSVLLTILILSLLIWTFMAGKKQDKSENAGKSQKTIQNEAGQAKIEKMSQLLESLEQLTSSKPSQTDQIYEAKKADKKVLVEVYMEARCPTTTRFIKRQLSPTYESLKSIIDLKVQSIFSKFFLVSLLFLYTVTDQTLR